MGGRHHSGIMGGLLRNPHPTYMADDPSKRGPADRSRISLLEPYEVQYWADKFGVSKERLSEAVRRVGHSADAVSRELGEHRSPLRVLKGGRS